MNKKIGIVKVISFTAGILLVAGGIIAVGFGSMKRENVDRIVEVAEETASGTEEPAEETQTGGIKIEGEVESGELPHSEAAEEAAQDKLFGKVIDTFEADGVTFYETGDGSEGVRPSLPEDVIGREEAAGIIMKEWKRLFPDAELKKPVSIMYKELDIELEEELPGKSNKVWYVRPEGGYEKSCIDAVTGECIEIMHPDINAADYGVEHYYNNKREDEEPWMNTYDFYEMNYGWYWIGLAIDAVRQNDMSNGEAILKDPQAYFIKTRIGVVDVVFTLGNGEDAETLVVFADLKTQEVIGYLRADHAFREKYNSL